MRTCCLWLILLTSCAEQTDSVQTLLYRTDSFILVDSAKPVHPGLLRAGETDDFPIFYIGARADTISIGKRYWPGRSSYSATIQDPFTKSYNSNQLGITVDSSVSCYSGAEFFLDGNPHLTDSTQWYHSFLLTLKNKSASTLYMGRTFSLYFLQLEGQGMDGQWSIIQQPLSEHGLCLTNEPEIFLRPGEIILSKIKRRTDPAFVHYRLAWVTYYSLICSNTFTL